MSCGQHLTNTVYQINKILGKVSILFKTAKILKCTAKAFQKFILYCDRSQRNSFLRVRHLSWSFNKSCIHYQTPVLVDTLECPLIAIWPHGWTLITILLETWTLIGVILAKIIIWNVRHRVIWLLYFGNNYFVMLCSFFLPHVFQHTFSRP